MADKKHYLITSLTLGLIAMTSAALIGATNLITKKRIAQNEIDRINAGISEIFGENTMISLEQEVNNQKYVVRWYTIKNDTDVMVGFACRTTGSNMYGKISLIVGFDYTSKVFEGLSIVVNEQTFASTLVDNYINPLNAEAIKLDDVTCGATYGAKLVRDMVNDAQSFIDGIIID